MAKKAQVTIFIIIGIVIIFIAALTFYIMDYFADTEMPINIMSGNEGDINISGAANEPPKIEKLPIGTKNFTVFFVPVNYAPNDTEFLQRVEELSKTISEQTLIANFKIVKQTYYPSNRQCPEASLIAAFADRWYERDNGKSLPPIAYEGRVPVYKYRVIGIDKNQQNLSICGCAYITDAFSPGIYIGGDACSRITHVVMHELGHSFGLCDEYDTCTWLETNLWMQRAYSSYCQNEKPNDATSDCGNKCCEKEKACCNGKYADTNQSGYFNVMGSANIPPGRRLSNETDEIIGLFLCEKYQICEELT